LAAVVTALLIIGALVGAVALFVRLCAVAADLIVKGI
jgi:hypothetical protein